MAVAVGWLAALGETGMVLGGVTPAANVAGKVAGARWVGVGPGPAPGAQAPSQSPASKNATRLAGRNRRPGRRERRQALWLASPRAWLAILRSPVHILRRCRSKRKTQVR